LKIIFAENLAERILDVVAGVPVVPHHPKLATGAVFPFGDSAERFGEWQHRFGRAKIGLAQSLLV
jgi:hypothetical protein